MSGFMKKQASFMDRVYAACRRIPRGRVSTYGAIARAVGKPGAFRAVGNALNRNRSTTVPCHRVVLSDGSIGGFAHGSLRKEKMLAAEGVGVANGKIMDFERLRVPLEPVKP